MYKTGMNPTGMNPSELNCFLSCASCTRCSEKGRYAKCQHCSGRHDPSLRKDPYDIDDVCRCNEGILQWRVNSGKEKGMLVQRRLKSDPFGGQVKTDAVSQDERDWNAYLKEKREIMNDPNWDPIIVEED